MSFYEEILQQPQVLANMQRATQDVIHTLIDEIGPEKHGFVAARGISDNTARNAKCMGGGGSKIPVTLAPAFLFCLDGQSPAMDDMPVLGISQSGESPDLPAVIQGRGIADPCPRASRNGSARSSASSSRRSSGTIWQGSQHLTPTRPEGFHKSPARYNSRLE